MKDIEKEVENKTDFLFWAAVSPLTLKGFFKLLKQDILCLCNLCS